MTRRLAISFMILCFVAAGLGLRNVFADNADVQALAKSVACGGTIDGCAVQMTRMGRNPIGQSFSFRAGAEAPDIEVACRRGYWLLGEWSCQPAR